MMHYSSNVGALRLNVNNQNPAVCCASVLIPAPLIDAIYAQSVISQKHLVPAFGFHKNGVPLSYVEHNFKNSLLDHVKEFLLKYMVLEFLYKEIRSQKILLAGEPRLSHIFVEPQKDGIFDFELSVYQSQSLPEWKYLPFRAPKRKNYKDLDRQVEDFLCEEEIQKEGQKDIAIGLGDWVNFTISLLDENKNPVLEKHISNVWIKVGDEEPDRAFQELLLKKKISETFITQNRCLQDYFSESLNTNYMFGVTILDVVSNAFFCVDLFKSHFKIKTNKETYQKLVEVFSYRNDLSQRRTTVEESLKLLLSKHSFILPKHLILRQQKVLLDIVQSNPDYHVYRVQRDFKDRIQELAEKQIREQIFIDQLAYEEDIVASNQDIKSYLNLTKRPRMKEFLYFDLPSTKSKGQESPIISEELKRTCLREKTINHIIYHLTKK